MTRLGRSDIQSKPGRSDSELQLMVMGELRWDFDVPDAKIGVEVDKGVVTLSGHVSAFAEKLAAQKAAHRVEGVLDVVNDLEVSYGEAPFAEDTQIALAVRGALEADSRVPSESILTTVNDGHVLLQGTIPNALSRYRAGIVVQHVRGVRSVTNAIEVAPPPSIVENPDNVIQGIEDALLRQASRRAKRIQVGLKDGIITLSGTVRSWPEREAAFESALHASGVYGVVNHLRIDPTV